jgi:TPR repeat protein
MNSPQEIGLIPANVAALSAAGAKTLAMRGRKDLLRIEEAREWLRKGMELHSDAFDDPGWQAMVEAQAHSRSQADRHAQFRTILEYLRLVKEGGDAETAATSLDMTSEDRETADTLSSFWPDTAASMVRAVQQERERHRAELLRHEERLQQAFLCFRTGYRLDPYNREIHYVLAEYYSVGLGVAMNEDTALNHLRKSAALGHRGAQRALGYRYSASLRNGPEQEPSPGWFTASSEMTQTAHSRSVRASS